MSTPVAYNPATAQKVFRSSRSDTRDARIHSPEALLHDQSQLGQVEFFEGPGDNPTGLTGYSSSKLWLRQSAGVQSTLGTVRRWNGNDANLLSSWPVMTRADWQEYWASSEISASYQPMEGQSVIIDVTPILSRWIAGLIYDDSEDRFFCLEHVGTGHVQNNSMLVVRETHDNFESMVKLRTLFSRASDPFIRAAAIGAMGSGRYGGIVITGENGSRKVWSLISDDKFATCTITEVTSSMTRGEHFVYGMLLPWPAAAGGHDTTGFQVLSYGGTNTDVKVIRTADNGATWSDASLKTSTDLPGAAQEPSMVQLGDGRWLLVVRTAADGNAWASVGNAAMTSFGSWVDTGIPLGSNPIHVLVEGEYVYANVFYREDFTGAVEENCLVSWFARSTDVASSPTALGAGTRRILQTLPSRAIGYTYSARRGGNGGWFHVFKAGEDDSTASGAGSALCVIRQLSGSVRGLMAAPILEQHVENPIFDVWPRGTTFSSTSTSQVVAGRWLLSPSGATCSVSRVEVPDAVRYALPFRSAYGLSMNNTGSANDFVGLQQQWRGVDAIPKAVHIANRQRIWVRLYGWGAFPSEWRCSISINSTTALRAGGSTAFVAPQGIEGNGPWVVEHELRTASLETLSISESAVTQVALLLDNGAASSEFTINLAGVFLFVGPTPPMQPVAPSIADAEEETARYIERIAITANDPVTTAVARTTTVAWGDLKYKSKVVSSPTITVSAATDFQLRSGTDNTLSAIEFQTISRDAARVVATVASGLTVGQGQLLEVVGSPSATPFLEISAGA